MPTIRDRAELEYVIDDSDIEESFQRQTRLVDQYGRAITSVSQRATKSRESETKAARGLTKEQERLEKRLETLERQSQLRGTRGVRRIRLQRQEFVRMARAAGASEDQLNKIATAFARVENRVAQATRKTRIFTGLLSGPAVAKGFVGGFVGFAALGGANQLGQFIRDTTVAAAEMQARIETLDTSMGVFARQSFQSANQLRNTAEELERIGLTTVQAREATDLFSRAGARQSEIISLVNVAMDAAVRRNLSLDDALQRLTRGLAKAEPELLDELGIVIKLNRVYGDYAKELGITDANLLGVADRSRALIRELAQLSEKGGEFAAIQGTASAALLDTNQQTAKLSENIGNLFTDESQRAISAWNQTLQAVNKVLESIVALQKRPGEAAALFGDGFAIAEGLRKFAEERRRAQKFVGPVLPPEEAARIAQSRFPIAAREVTGEGRLAQTFSAGFFERAGIALEKRLKDIARAEQQTGRLLDQAIERRLSGMEKLIAQAEREQQQFGLSTRAQQDLQRALQNRVLTEAQRIAALKENQPVELDFLAKQRDAQIALLELEARAIEVSEQRLPIRARILSEELRAQAQKLQQERDLELASIEFVSTREVAARVLTEGRKFEIEKRFIERSLALQEEKIRAETALRIAAEPDLVAELERLQSVQLRQLRAQARTDVSTAQRELARDQTEIIVRENERVFDSLKRSADGVFDAMLLRGENFFSALANSLKVALLTGIKEVLSTQVASGLLELFGTGPFSRGLPSRSGGLGLPGVLGGLIPGLGSLSRPGAPGGTPGFAGPVLTPSLGAANRSLAGLGAAGFGVQGFSLGALRDFFGLGSSISTGAGATTFQAASLLQKLGSFAGSPGGALVGGSLLALGLSRRGGAAGLGLSTGGGALLGFSLGGPIGAGIGAAAGGIGSLVSGLFQKATDKAREQIQSIYGIRVGDRSVLRHIVGIAKDQFAGNIGIAIRSPVVRDLLELFAASTGQDIGRVGTQNLRFVSAFSGGQLGSVAQFRFGRPIAQQSTLPTLGPFSGQTTILRLDGDATTKLLKGEAVTAMAENPRAVQASVNQASRENSGRVSTPALGLEPRTLLA